MKEKINLLMLTLMAVLASVCVSSCGGEDEESNENEVPNAPEVKMVCSSFTSSGTSGTIYENITYDEKGRVISYDKDDGGPSTSMTHYTYSYGNGEIKLYQDGSLRTIFTLSSDGLITKSQSPNSDYETRYKYENGYLVTVQPSENGKMLAATLYTWKDGNLVKDVYEDDVVYCLYTYSNEANILPSFQRHNGQYFDDIDVFLQYTGFFGKKPKNLLERIDYKDDTLEHNEYSKDYSYLDMNELGYPTYCKFGSVTYRVNWKKL